MSEINAKKYAGEVLRQLIKEYYSSQEEFAFAFDVDIRNVSRWINQGVNKVDIIQELALHFDVPLKSFLPD